MQEDGLCHVYPLESTVMSASSAQPLAALHSDLTKAAKAAHGNLLQAIRVLGSMMETAVSPRLLPEPAKLFAEAAKAYAALEVLQRELDAATEVLSHSTAFDIRDAGVKRDAQQALDKAERERAHFAFFNEVFALHTSALVYEQLPLTANDDGVAFQETRSFCQELLCAALLPAEDPEQWSTDHDVEPLLECAKRAAALRAVQPLVCIKLYSDWLGSGPTAGVYDSHLAALRATPTNARMFPDHMTFDGWLAHFRAARDRFETRHKFKPAHGSGR